jgi:circadian clock protein KaiB
VTRPKSSSAAFEAASERAQTERYVLRLYIAGATPGSSRSVETVRAICEEHLNGRYELAVVDVFQQPVLAKDEQIIALPTLIKELPAPLRRMVGDLSNAQRVLSGLDLKQKTHAPPKKRSSQR